MEKTEKEKDLENVKMFVNIGTLVLYALKGHYNSSTICHAIHIFLIVAILVSPWPVVPAILYIALQPKQRATAHKLAGDAFVALQGKLEQTENYIDINNEEADYATRMKNYRDEYVKLCAQSPQIMTLAYKMTQRGLKKGEAKFDDKDK